MSAADIARMSLEAQWIRLGCPAVRLHSVWLSDDGKFVSIYWDCFDTRGDEIDTLVAEFSLADPAHYDQRKFSEMFDPATLQVVTLN